jgi:hypothetical protein
LIRGRLRHRFSLQQINGANGAETRNLIEFSAFILVSSAMLQRFIRRLALSVAIYGVL